MPLAVDTPAPETTRIFVAACNRPTSRRSTTVLTWGWSPALECVLVVALPVIDLADEQVALRVGGGAMSMKELSRVVASVPSDIGDDFERLAVQHPHRLVGPINDVKEALLLVWRQHEMVDRAFGLKRAPRDEDFFDKRAIEFEDLESVVRSVGYVDQFVIRYDDGVHRIVELWGRLALNELRASREFETVIGFLPVRAPVPFVRARVRVEHDDAVVEISVGDEQLVRFLVNE